MHLQPCSVPEPAVDDVAHVHRADVQLYAAADDDLVAGGPALEHVQRLGGADTDASPLPHRVAPVPLVPSHDGALAVDDVTGQRLDAATLEEALVPLDGEADLLALGLVRHLETGLRRGGARLGLGELAERELEARQDPRRHRPQHVRLVLGAVGGARHEGLAVPPHQAGVVTGGHARQAQLTGQGDERRQAHRVAVDAGVGRLAAQVAALERSHDRVLELGLEVEDVMRKAELRGGTGGALQSTGRAATAPVRPRPQPRRRRLQAAALVDQPQRRDGAIHPAAQCDECSCSFGSALRICSTSASRPFLTR